MGRGSEELTGIGARGAPRTPSIIRRSHDFLLPAEELIKATRESCPFIHWPRVDATLLLRLGSPPESGPSISGAKVRLLDLVAGASRQLWRDLLPRRDMVDLGRERAGERPRTTSVLRDAKKHCGCCFFFSIVSQPNESRGTERTKRRMLPALPAERTTRCVLSS
ncbi:hypothetical protein SAY87_020953 [Trapa incisa]|uniref:Uncharacterized protein n=1 Tax=Trapa incisa TaxID=236973 RepID=A0AAN7JRL3_9MYRT|nr:hypothetical protein SAY87_020953 [Trapa incisa]